MGLRENTSGEGAVGVQVPGRRERGSYNSALPQDSLSLTVLPNQRRLKVIRGAAQSVTEDSPWKSIDLFPFPTSS